MDWTSFVPTIGSILGSIGQGIFSSHSASKAVARQKELWTYMQSNAHQLEVEDLKKAGLNPILSASNSQLAGMPSVSQERVPDNDVGMALSSAVQAAMQDKQLRYTYDIELKKLANVKRELDIKENQSAAQINLLQSQREEVLKRVDGIAMENRWKEKLLEANHNQVHALATKFLAEANESISRTGYTELQKEKLRTEFKYGEIAVRYIPREYLPEFVSKIGTIIGHTDFEKFIDKLSDSNDDSSTSSIVHDFLRELVRRGILTDKGPIRSPYSH